MSSKPQSVKELTVKTAGGITLEYFPDELNALREEIDFHPQLQAILAGQADKDVYVHIAEIAAYCNILLAGDYTRDDIIELCGKFTEELKKRRTISVHSDPRITPILPNIPGV